ncbi:hypothetical protein Y032_0043g881 [Ancylostoma ceylanicum]|uniref:Uncharacterized protein n=1 Tax=Ancylostoma ceylanicum TaxID=53326 RepID=A0A016UEG7_9BILA|nr:hypothetical protein Y032_0043g881 [Ancylostoma ceylanicum]
MQASSIYRNFQWSKHSSGIRLFGVKSAEKSICTVGVDGGDPSAATKSTRHDRASHDGIVAAAKNLSFLDSCSSHLMITIKKINVLLRKPHNLISRKGFLLERSGRAAGFPGPQTGHRHRRLL